MIATYLCVDLAEILQTVEENSMLDLSIEGKKKVVSLT